MGLHIKKQFGNVYRGEQIQGIIQQVLKSHNGKKYVIKVWNIV